MDLTNVHMLHPVKPFPLDHLLQHGKSGKRLSAIWRKMRKYLPIFVGKKLDGISHIAYNTLSAFLLHRITRFFIGWEKRETLSSRLSFFCAFLGGICEVWE